VHMPSASMRDPKTSFGKWFEQVKAKEERGLGSGNAGGGNGDGGSSGFLGKLKFWGQSPNAAAGEPDVERGGLLPSFMRSAPAESSSEWCDCGLSAYVSTAFVCLMLHACRVRELGVGW